MNGSAWTSRTTVSEITSYNAISRFTLNTNRSSFCFTSSICTILIKIGIAYSNSLTFIENGSTFEGSVICEIGFCYNGIVTTNVDCTCRSLCSVILKIDICYSWSWTCNINSTALICNVVADEGILDFGSVTFHINSRCNITGCGIFYCSAWNGNKVTFDIYTCTFIFYSVVIHVTVTYFSIGSLYINSTATLVGYGIGYIGVVCRKVISNNVQCWTFLKRLRIVKDTFSNFTTVTKPYDGSSSSFIRSNTWTFGIITPGSASCEVGIFHYTSGTFPENGSSRSSCSVVYKSTVWYKTVFSTCIEINSSTVSASVVAFKVGIEDLTFFIVS